MYVVVVVNEDDDENDVGSRHGLGEYRDNRRDRRDDRWRGTSVDAGEGAGCGAAGRRGVHCSAG